MSQSSLPSYTSSSALITSKGLRHSWGGLLGLALFLIVWLGLGYLGTRWLFSVSEILAFIGLIWLYIGAIISSFFFRPSYIAIKEPGFRLEGAAIDLNPDRYKQSATLSANDDPLEIRNSTVHTVRVHPLRSDDPARPAFSLQRSASGTADSEITLAAGQSGWLTFDLAGDYNITAHRLDGLVFPYNHLIVRFSASSTITRVIITDQGFLMANTVADLRSASYLQSPWYLILGGMQVPFKNLSQQAVQLCLGRNGVCDPQAVGPEELRSGLTLAPGQSASVTFNEIMGNYSITVRRLDGTVPPFDHFIVQITSAAPMAVITNWGFLIAKTVTDLRFAASPTTPQPAKYSIEERSQVPFKNLSQQAVQLCLGRNGICDPQAGGPEELRSGLTLAPGQSASVTFPDAGNYHLTCYTPDQPPFAFPNLDVTVISWND